MSAPNRVAGDLLEALNSRDLERFAALHTADYEGLDSGHATPHRGPEGSRATLERYLNAFPDLRVEVEQTVVQEDRVAGAWVATGTHQGRLLNIPPTGRKVQVRGISLLTFRGGKLASALHYWDLAGLLRALGLLPDL